MKNGLENITKDIRAAKEMLDLKKRNDLISELYSLECELDSKTSMNDKLILKDKILEIKIQLEEIKPALAVYSNDCASCGS